MTYTKTIPSNLVAALDGVSVAAAMAGAYYLRIGGSVLPYYGPKELESYIAISAFMVPVWLAIHFAARLYDPDIMGSGVDEYLQIVKASTFGVVVMITLTFWDRLILSRGWVLILWVLSVALLTLERFSLRQQLLRARSRGVACERALIVGANQRAISIVKQFNHNPSAGVTVVAFLDDSLPTGAVVTENVFVWGSPSELADAIQSLRATEVLVISEALDWETFQDVVSQVAELPPVIRVRICPRLDELLSSGVRLGKKANVPVLTLSGLRIDPRAAVLKRVTDCLLAMFLLAVTGPILVLLSAVCRAIAGSPVVDRYRAFGMRGVPFTALKFHTGLLGTTRRTFAPSSRGVLPSDGQAPSSLGDFLYRTALDKLPQLWNVLRGDMSLVGPRIASVEDHEMVGRWLPTISSLRPGMTGPWAISDSADFEEEMQATLYYIRNWNFGRDIIILMKTLLHILKSGATVSRGYIPKRPNSVSSAKPLGPSLQQVASQ